MIALGRGVALRFNQGQFPRPATTAHIIGAKAFLNRLEPFGALCLHLGQDLIVTLGRRRSLTLRLAENVNLRKTAYLSHTACLKEVFFSFARETHNNVGRKR